MFLMCKTSLLEYALQKTHFNYYTLPSNPDVFLEGQHQGSFDFKRGNNINVILRWHLINRKKCEH